MSGRGHEAQGLPLGVLLASPWAFGQGQEALAFLVAYTVGTLYLSPDLDLEGSRPSRRWGPLGFLWTPYRLLHPHRGRSHSPFYGPLSRLLYLLGLLAIPYGLLPPEVRLLLRPWGEALLPYLPPALLGYWLSQWVHLAQDGLLIPRPRRR